METSDSNRQGGPDAPRSGASAPAPFLDNKGRNLPKERKPAWTKKQWITRRAVLDRLSSWQGSGYQVLWVTLTSAPESPLERLRANFQALRKRLERDFGFGGFEYICVDTREGHGVLHMLWAWRDPNPAKRSSFYVPFIWLQDAWKEIHGAFHVNVKRVRGGDADAKRLSAYIVSQYCGDQNALVRVSQSRREVPFAKMRAALLRTLRNLPERFEYNHRLAELKWIPDNAEFQRFCNRWFWMEFRHAWDELARYRSCSTMGYGPEFYWWDGELRRV